MKYARVCSIVILLFTFLVGSHSALAASSVAVQSDEYWDVDASYPTVGPNAYLYHAFANGLDFNPNTIVNVHRVCGNVSWADIETSQGVYDWAQLESSSCGTGDRWLDLNEIKARGDKALLRVLTSKNGTVPQWVLDSCGPTLKLLAGSGGSSPTAVESGDIYNLWHPCARPHHEAFIAALSARYGSDPDVIAIYFPGWKAGEFNLLDPDMVGSEDSTFRNNNFSAWCDGLVDAFLDNGTPAHKVLFLTHKEHGFGPVSSSAVSQCVQRILITEGMSVRDGGAEFAKLGRRTSRIKFILGADKFLAPGETNRYYTSGHTQPAPFQYWSEGEEVCEMGFDLDADGVSSPLSCGSSYIHYHNAIIKQRRRGVNGLHLPAELTMDDDPGNNFDPRFFRMAQWWLQTAGYSASNSPDAIIQLHELGEVGGHCPTNGPNGNSHYFWNEEVLITQREVALDGETALAERHTFPLDQAKEFSMCDKDPGRAYIYLARRTQLASGHDHIYFWLDDGFYDTAGPHDLEISVRYLDNSNASWCIEYDDGSSANTCSATVNQVNDGQWKTAVFSIDDFHENGSQADGADFSISTTTADVSVHKVRVIRQSSGGGGGGGNPPPPTSLRVEAEDMTSSPASGGYRTENLATASGGVVMNLKGGTSNGHTATLSAAFSGATGTYDIELGYHDEQDGDSTLTVDIDGQQIDSIVLDLPGLGTQPSATNFRTWQVGSGVSISNGDLIEITGVQETWDHANVDYIEFVSVGPPNQAPMVDAGVDQVITLPGAASLNGMVADDDLPSPPTLTTTWSTISGPGAVTFADSNAAATTATFSLDGVYVLRLTASDGALSGEDDIQITVNAAPAGVRLEAESMTSTPSTDGYKVEAVATSSGGVVMNLKGGGSNGHTATLSTTFAEASGYYDIIIGYHDEQDGDSTLTTSIAGQQIDSFVLDASGLGTQPSASNFLTRPVGSSIAINNGDLIEVTGVQETWDHANVDYLEFTFLAPLAPPDVRIEAESMASSPSSGGYKTENVATSSGGVVMNLKGGGGSGQTATLSVAFSGITGTYDVILGYHDEQDGDATLTTDIAGQQIDTFVLGLSGLGNQPSATNFLTRQIATDLQITNGDLIEITGVQETWDHANVDYIEFIGK